MNQYNISQAIDVALLATVIKREARGETYNAMLGVGWSIRNRVESPRWWGHDWFSVITKPEQYTSIEPPTAQNDPNLRVYVDSDSNLDTLVIQAAEAVYWTSEADPTNGATHYYDRSMDDNPPSWTRDGSSEHVCELTIYTSGKPTKSILSPFTPGNKARALTETGLPPHR